MQKITLINPPQFSGYPQPPLGLASLAGVLEQAGHRVTIIDANVLNLAPEAVVTHVPADDIIGITAMTPTIGTATGIAREIKRRGQNPTIILGGAHATLLPEETMEASPDIDIIVRGEGETTILELLAALDTGTPLEQIPGIIFRRNGAPVKTPIRPGHVPMDSLPFPAYHLLTGYAYRPHPPHGLAKPFMAVVTSRGCPYRCSYCSKPVFGSTFRAQNPERVVAELVYLKERFGVKEVAFYDDVFTLDKKRAMEITRLMIERKLNLRWTCETRVNLVDKPLLEQMKRAGCYAVAYGIESASPEINQMLQKDVSREQIVEAVSSSRKAGIQVIGYLMIGSPGETRETIEDTIDLAKDLKLDYAQFSVTTPFPATELYRLYLDEHHDTIPWESFVYSDVASHGAPVFESPELNREEIRRWVKRAYRSFYLRPSYLWQRFTALSSPAELLLNFKGFLMLLGSLFSRAAPPARGKETTVSDG